MQGLGRQASLITAAIAGVGAITFNAAASMDTAARKISTVADMSILSLDGIKDSTRDLATELKVMPTDVAAGLYDLISANGDTANSFDYMRIAGEAAVGGFAEQSVAVDGLTTVLNAYGETGAAAMQRVSDEMITAQNYGKTTMGQIAGSIGNVIPLAAQLQVHTDELFGSLAVLTKMGIGTSEAVTGLKGAFSGIIKPTSEASKLAKELGLDFSAEALQSKGLIGFLMDVTEKTGGSTEKMSQLFGSVEALNSVLALTSTQGQNEMTGAMTAMQNSAGATDKAFETMTGGFEGSIDAAKVAFANLGSEFGESFAPTVQWATDGITDLTNAFAALTPETRSTIVNVAGVVAALGPVLMVSGKVVSAVGEINKGVEFLSGLVGGGGTLALIAAGLAGITTGVIALNGYIESLSGESKIKAAFETVHVDTKAIDTAIDNAQSTTYNLELTANAKIKLSDDSESLNAQIIQWLTDGKAETEAQKKDYQSKAEEVIAPVYSAIQAAFDAKKKALDDQLSNGIIDKKTYDARLAELKSTTDATKGSLDTEAQAYVSYVMTLAAQGTKPTQDQIDKLEALRQKVVEVGQAIIDANNSAAQAAKASYTATTAGVGSKEDIVVGVKYAQTETQGKQDALKTKHDQMMADLQKQWDDASKSKSPIEARINVEALMDSENKDYEEQKRKIQEQYSKMISDMIDGLAKEYPEQAAKLKEVMGKQNLVEQLTQAITDVSSDDPKVAEAGQTALDNLYSALNNGEKNFTGNNTWALTAVDDLKGQIGDTIKTADFSGIFSDFSTAINAGALTGLDVSGVGDTLKSLITAYDLTPDGKTVGEQLITGEVAGITESKDGLNTAILDAVNAGNKTLTDAQGIHSPSTVWKGYGINLMSGLADGIALGKVRVDIQTALLSISMKSAGKDSIQGLINGVEAKRAALVGEYKSLARAAIQAARREMGIASPSKVFAEIGGYTVSGFVEGIDRRSADAREAVQRLFNSDELIRQNELSLSMQRLAVGPSQITGAGNTYSTANTVHNTYGAPMMNITVNNPNVRSDQDLREMDRRLQRLSRDAAIGLGRRP